MAHFDRLTVFNTILADGMVPLFYHDDLDIARNIVGALVQGGSHVLEFTNRGDFAIEIFSSLVKHCIEAHPAMIVGVGSIEDAPTAALFIAHGANFIVGPTFQPEIARLCNRRKIAYMPGCGSVNEIAAAEEWGAEIVKVFPGDSVGGADFVRAARGPRPWSRIMPTGGVKTDEADLRRWFEAGVACVGLGSGLIGKELLEARDFDTLTHDTRAVLATIDRIRNG